MDLPQNSFKHAIAAGRQQIGLWCSLASNYAVEVVAGSGYDWLLLDTEHAPNEIPMVLSQLQAAMENNVHPIVRPAWNDMVLIKRFLDMGVQTLLLPVVNTAEEARAAVAGTRYPPRGVRGFSGSSRSSRFGRIKDYHTRCEDEICVLVQVEIVEGLRNIEAIASVEGIDGVFIGPGDLSAALGHLGNPKHPEVLAAIEDAIRRIQACGKAAGILTGDVLLAIDGRAIPPEMTVPEIIELVKGEKGTTVVLTVRHPGAAEPVDISVVRDDILLPSVVYRLMEQDPTIGYIQLSRFSGESGNEVGGALQSLQAQGATQFILDLRQNGGGLRDAAVEVTDHFLADGPLLILESQEDGERVFNATAETIALNEPLVVLVDGGTASASEIVAGALQDRERAILIGNSRTFGKGSVQLVFDLSDGSSVHVTSARWLTPNRHQIDQSGLEPDLMVEVTQDDVDNGRDPVLDRAIAYLQEVTP